MRYGSARKEETRRRVVSAAAAAIRARGPDRVGVAEIMAEVGLTHGGFYAHFRSKEALIAAAVAEAFEQGARRVGGLVGDRHGLEALEAFIEAYVSMQHRDHPEQGCPLAAIASDLPRQGAQVRAAFGAGVAGMIEGVAERLPPGNHEERRSLAGSLVAEMAGAVTLSRALGDEAAARFLEQSRRHIRARAQVPDAAAPCAVTAASPNGA